MKILKSYVSTQSNILLSLPTKRTPRVQIRNHPFRSWSEPKASVVESCNALRLRMKWFHALSDLGHDLGCVGDALGFKVVPFALALTEYDHLDDHGQFSTGNSHIDDKV